MFSPLRNRFGIPGVISVIALVFAMFGGAYAASNSGGGGKATASAKGKPGPRGPRGKTGPAGPAGPAGPQGPAGAKGDKGDAGAKGDKGDKGEAGTNGTSVTSSVVGAGGDAGHCVTVGGSKFVAGASTTYACNGAEGAEGEAGVLHPGETLPSEATETGTWTIESAAAGEHYSPVSFPIPLSAADAPTITTHFQGESGFATSCPGSARTPKANPGVFCVYKGIFNELNSPSAILRPDGESDKEPEGEVGISGALIKYESLAAGKRVTGSFAVTAP